MNTKSLATVVLVSTVVWTSNALAEKKIADADASQVANCTFVKDVNGRSVFGERLKEQGATEAKDGARAQAEKAGATTIVWGKISQTDVTIVEGKAYRCPN